MNLAPEVGAPITAALTAEWIYLFVCYCLLLEIRRKLSYEPCMFTHAFRFRQ